MRAIAAFLACTLACSAADREFRDIVRAISDEFHTQPLHIPFFGLVNFVTFVARPAGTRHIDLAVFENLNTADRCGRDIAQAIRNSVRGDWQPFVQVHSHRKGAEEVVFIWMRPEGRDCNILVTTVEPKEATVVQLKLNPDALQKWLVQPRDSLAHRSDW